MMTSILSERGVETFSLSFSESYVKKILFQWKLNHVRTVGSCTGCNILLHPVMPCCCYFQHYPTVQFFQPGELLCPSVWIKEASEKGMFNAKWALLFEGQQESMALCINSSQSAAHSWSLSSMLL